VCSHFKPQQLNNIKEVNRINKALLHKLNTTGTIYLTHTKVNGIYTLRMAIGQINVDQKHIEKAWELITSRAVEITISQPRTMYMYT